ncbi:MAG: hypothetical protein GF317_12840 [Candidatus Lokiarchaeota archaeon]|nr:hypothetical protein [Candidatus Lokiarchaeota archaeon]MBD3200528.1 hypothetical protein [Candidatus Lokiarchaeota archaeon]
MGIESLNAIEITHGVATFIYVIFSILIGIRFLTKYVSLKRKELITVGLAWIFLSSAWWGSSFSFLSIVLFNQPIQGFIFFFIANAFIPVAVVCWIYSFLKIIYPDLIKIGTILILVLSIAYEIILLYFLFQPESTYPLYIGEIKETFYYQPSLLTMLFQVLALLVSAITGFIFSIKSMKSDEPVVKWKGRFLLIAFSAFTIGSLFDALITLDQITIVIVRVILLISSIAYYLGFLLPDQLAEMLREVRK